MKSKIFFLFALLIGVTFLMNSSNLAADDWNKAATIVLKTPAEIPGHVLPAGMYVFKLLDDDYNHHIVQIWNAEQTKLVATAMAWTRQFNQAAPADSALLLEKQGEGLPPIVKVWYHPGISYGEEFIYSSKKK